MYSPKSAVGPIITSFNLASSLYLSFSLLYLQYPLFIKTPCSSYEDHHDQFKSRTLNILNIFTPSTSDICGPRKFAIRLAMAHFTPASVTVLTHYISQRPFLTLIRNWTRDNPFQLGIFSIFSAVAPCIFIIHFNVLCRSPKWSRKFCYHLFSSRVSLPPPPPIVSLSKALYDG